jgi:hypothetical protein
MTTRHLVMPPELGLHRVSWRAQRGRDVSRMRRV